MEENKAQRILLTIVIILIGNFILRLVFFGKGVDALFYVMKRHEIMIENGTEYVGTPMGYSQCEVPTDYGSQTQYYQIVRYVTKNGEEKSAASSMTDEERGGPLPESVLVVDNGERAVIQEDLDAMQEHILIGVIAVLIRVVFTLGAIIVSWIIGKRKQRAAQW